MDTVIRRAKAEDTQAINSLLRQVLNVHSEGRGDLFKKGSKKYTDAELAEIIADDNRPVFVIEDGERVVGYAFCVFVRHLNDNILTDIKTLYIDDLCVDENSRGKHLGERLYRYVRDFAEKSGCYNLTLNVWACNPNAMAFYEKMGLKPQKIGMETIL